MNQSKKKWKTILVVAALFIFAVGTYVFTGDSEGKLSHSTDSKPMRQAKAVNKDDFPLQWGEMETYEEVKQFFEERVPGLALAREKGLTIYPQQSAPIPKRNGRTQINEVWHSGHMIQIFYSIDLSALVDDEEKKNKFLNSPPSLEGISIEGAGDIEPQTLSTYSRELNPRDTVIFENRLYGMVQVPPISNEEWGYQQATASAQNFDRELPTSLQFRINGKSLRTDFMPVRYHHDRKAHVIQTYTTNQTYSEDGLLVEPLKVQLGVASSRFKVKIEHEKAEFNQTLEASIQTDKGEQVPVSLFLVEQEERIYEGWFHPLQEVPEDISLELSAVHLKKDASYSFEIDMSKFEGYENQSYKANEKIAEVFETDITLDRIDYHGGHHISAELRFEPHSYDQKEKAIGSPIHPFNFSPEGRPTYVHVESEDGKTVDANFHGEEKQANIDFEAMNFDDAATLKVTIEKIVYAHQVNQSYDLTAKEH